MLNYLKDRFKEYVDMTREEKKLPQKKVSKPAKPANLYTDFEILYEATDVLVGAFSMTEEEVSKDFYRSLRENLSDVLEVNKGNITILGKDKDDVVCEINYTGRPGEAILHRIRPIAEKDEIEIEYNDLDEELSKHDYTNNAYSMGDWHCLRCGGLLAVVPLNDEWWGEWAWHAMEKDGTLWYLCTNDKCCHSSSPLVLHQPNSYNSPAGRDGYSLSWMK